MNEPMQKTISFATLRGKEVVNSSDGSIIGHVSDLELEGDLHSIRALLIPPLGGVFSLSRKNELRIPINAVERIGEDVILIRAPLHPEKSAP